jgi:hypothetical protein
LALEVAPGLAIVCVLVLPATLVVLPAEQPLDGALETWVTSESEVAQNLQDLEDVGDIAGWEAELAP